MMKLKANYRMGKMSNIGLLWIKLKSCALRVNVDADDERKSRLTFDEDYE
jgi:hypothetical protein